MAFLAVENLTFTYPGRTDAALKNVSFQADKGEFITICGATGSGKSTLLRLLKKELSPLGIKTGRISLSGTLQDDLSDADAAYKIGFVCQRPEQQLVTDKVWHELAFGLENMNLPRAAIARRVSEMAAYFGMTFWSKCISKALPKIYEGNLKARVADGSMTQEEADTLKAAFQADIIDPLKKAATSLTPDLVAKSVKYGITMWRFNEATDEVSNYWK